MALNLKTPGVYVQEVSKFPPSVAQVETAIPAFVGYTEKALDGEKNLTSVPTRITSLLEYETFFGGANLETTIEVTITDTLDPDDNVVDRQQSAAFKTPKSNYLMYYSMQMYFANGGGPCYIVSVGSYSSTVSKTDLSDGLKKLETEDEPTLLLFPDVTNVANANDFNAVYSDALAQCNLLQDRFTILDTFSNGSFSSDITEFRTFASPYLKYGAAYYPYLDTILPHAYDPTIVTLKHVTDKGGVIGVGTQDGKTIDELKSLDDSLYNLAKAEINSLTVQLPPSSSVAGIFARVDNNRGVWKSPANESVAYIKGPVVKLTNTEQDQMNIDPTAGKSINAIRAFSGKGTLVWGARTLAGNDNEWRYVSVRRFFNMAEESIKKASERFVFESNDANTWIQIKVMIENFLTLQWRNGALQGAKTSEAFYVKVGLGETMTYDDVLNGKLFVEIGMAVVRPAEFIVLKFSHKMQES